VQFRILQQTVLQRKFPKCAAHQLNREPLNGSCSCEVGTVYFVSETPLPNGASVLNFKSRRGKRDNSWYSCSARCIDGKACDKQWEFYQNSNEVENHAKRVRSTQPQPLLAPVSRKLLRHKRSLDDGDDVLVLTVAPGKRLGYIMDYDEHGHTRTRWVCFGDCGASDCKYKTLALLDRPFMEAHVLGEEARRDAYRREHPAALRNAQGNKLLQLELLIPHVRLVNSEVEPYYSSMIAVLQ
jgi:hypothetical protein